MVGRNPHRPEGKPPAADDPRHKAISSASGAPYQAPSQKEEYEQNLANMDRTSGGPGTVPAEEPLGGSRPGVPSRVREAIERREATERQE